jgi:hypothetical protein
MSRQYLEAAKMIDAVNEGENLKAFCASKRVGKVDFALAHETMKYRSVLDNILLNCNLNCKILDVRQSLLLVMVYELLLGRFAER